MKYNLDYSPDTRQRSIFEIHHMCGVTVLLGIISSCSHILSQMNEPFSQHKECFWNGMILFQFWGGYSFPWEYGNIIFAESSEDDTLARIRGSSKFSHALYFLANKGHYIFCIFSITNLIRFRDWLHHFGSYDVVMYVVLSIHLVMSCLVIFAFCRWNSLSKKLEHQ